MIPRSALGRVRGARMQAATLRGARQFEGAPDLGRQPRLAVEATVRLVGILITGSALIAITQPFLPGYAAVVVLLGAQRAIDEAEKEHDPLAEARTMFPGLGAPVRFELKPNSPAVGRTLAELELRGATGATVLAMVRGEQGIAVPDAHAPLQAGDVLALAGTDEAIERARLLLAEA